MNSNPSPNDLVDQISQIQRMIRGKLCIIGQGANGPFYNCQSWENGKNVSRYVPRDKVADFQAAIEGYKQFEQIVEQYAQQIIQRTHDELAADAKKKTKNLPRKSSSPKRRKSSS